MVPQRFVCVFCGAQDAVTPSFLDTARLVGKRLAESKLGLVFGGGDCGMMGAVAHTVMHSGGYVVGVFPKILERFENHYTDISENIVVGSMHERKETMYARSDAFVILPGGFGTLDELFEIVTWKQIGLHDKPIFILNDQGYWDALSMQMKVMVEHGFVKERVWHMLRVVDTVDELMRQLKAALNHTAHAPA